MEQLTFDPVRVPMAAINRIRVNKEIINRIGKILEKPHDDDIIEKIIEQDVAPEDHELVTSMIDMAIATNKFELVARKIEE